jgi:hypothetical protein
VKPNRHGSFLSFAPRISIGLNGLDYADEKVSLVWGYEMARTHKKVRYSPSSKETKYTPATAASGVEQAFRFLEGRWKLVILFRLFGGKMLRFSDLERAIPAMRSLFLPTAYWSFHVTARRAD